MTAPRVVWSELPVLFMFTFHLTVKMYGYNSILSGNIYKGTSFCECVYPKVLKYWDT